MNSYSKDILLLNISRFDHYIELANNKANWLLTSLFTLLLGVFALIGYSDIIKNITNGNHIIIHIITFLNIASFLALIFFNIQAFYYLNFVLNSNLKLHLGGNSIIFFGDISNKSFPDFSKKIDELDENRTIEDLKEQVYILADITNTKHQNIIKVNKIIMLRIMPASLVVCFFSCFSKLISLAICKG